MRRYLIVLPNDASAYGRWKTILDSDDTLLAGFTTVQDDERCVVLSQSASALIGTAGAVVGELFRRNETAAATMTESETAAALATRGETLVSSFWGAYVAVLPNARGVDVIRAPFGDLACYFIAAPGGTLLASDIDLLMKFGGYSPDIDWRAIAAHLLAPDLRRSRTCLTGVQELAGGERLSTPGGTLLKQLWSPWSFVPSRRAGIEADELTARLFAAICDAVEARTAGRGSTILLLSGGLDSSIVAAALANAGRSCTALTMVTRDPGGDERAFARAAAAHCAIPLIEVVRDVAVVDIERSASAGLPYPAERSFSQATMQSAAAIAASLGAGAIVHGGGGDNIFCGIQSAAPVADLLRNGIIGEPLRSLTKDIAAIAHVSTSAVLRQAASRAWLRSPDYRWQINAVMLSADALQEAATAVRHPWLSAPQGALPGAAAHIGHLVAALSIVQSPLARADIPSLALLMAQPVVEACLAVPSWLWFERERNRAIARRAFSPRLPDSIAWRRSKGAMDSFVVELFEDNRPRLSVMLLDGMLAASGLIDRDRLRAVLEDRGPPRGHDYGRVMQFADVEAWLRSWS